MPKRSGKPKAARASRDSLLLGALHGADGDSSSKETLPQATPAQPGGTVSIGDVSVILVNAENPGVTAGDVCASNIVGGKNKRNRRGSTPAAQPPTLPKLKNDGDEWLPFQEMVWFLECSAWKCVRSFVHSVRYELEVHKPDRMRRGIRKLVPSLQMDSFYDAPRELVHALKDQLFPVADRSPTFYLAEPNGRCGYQILDAVCAMESLTSLQPPLYVFVEEVSIHGLHALLNSIHLLCRAADFEAFFAQLNAAGNQDVFILGILDVTQATWCTAAKQLHLTSQETSALCTQLENFRLIASFDNGDVRHSHLLHTLRPDVALCICEQCREAFTT